MAGKKSDTAPEVSETLAAFDVKEWLNGTTNPKTTVTIYRDGEGSKRSSSSRTTPSR